MPQDLLQPKLNESYNDVGIVKPVPFSKTPFGNRRFTRTRRNEPVIPPSIVNGNVDAQLTWINGFLQSLGFTAGRNGWKLNYDGTAIFNGDGTLVSTNFLKLLTLGNVEIWESDGTSPNGVLNAPKGSLCLVSSATGQLAYNTDDATAWTLL